MVFSWLFPPLDFFELNCIILPLLAPVADKLGIDLIWFGILMGVNMQTSFMHPPFGFALFYLRSVAPEPYVEIAPWSTSTGARFHPLVFQVIMVACGHHLPSLITMGFDSNPDHGHRPRSQH